MMGMSILCGEPEVPRYGAISDSTEFTYPNTVTFMCEQGYVLQGSAILRCESNGQWSSSPPKCQPADGPFPWWVLVIVVVIFLSISTYIVAKCFIKYCGESDDEPIQAEAEERQSLQADDRRAANDDTDDAANKATTDAEEQAILKAFDIDDR